jgi:hypothetical protein
MCPGNCSLLSLLLLLVPLLLQMLNSLLQSRMDRNSFDTILVLVDLFSTTEKSLC